MLAPLVNTMRVRWPRLSLMLPGFGMVLACALAWSAPMRTGGDAERGRSLYETGTDASGHSMAATRLGAGTLRGMAVACVNCHRPSTYGGIEGGLLVPPITGHILFAPGRPPSVRMNMKWMRHQTRSAYDTAKFSRALTHGVDPDGQPLGPEMPRYALAPRDHADLAAYLVARGQEPVPGLRAGVLHLATVFTPDAPKARRDTIMKAMQAWAVGMKLGRVPVIWQPWELRGEPSSWGAQLASLNERAPVFSLISGAGGAHWEPVQDFCERQRVACLFPSVDRIPTGTPPPLLTTYFSTGVDGEARMLAQWLSSSGGRAPRDLLQTWRGSAAWSAVQTLARATRPPWRTAPPQEWQGAYAKATATVRGGIRVLWLNADDASAWLKTHPPGVEREVYLSAQLAPAQLVHVPEAWRPTLRWLSMRAAPTDFYGALAVTLEPWAQTLAARGEVSPVEFADARAATFLFGDAAGLTQGGLRPDYLIERLETAVQQRTAASVYVHASLGPGQRVASKGGFVLGFRPGRLGAPVALSPYLRSAP